MLNCVYGRRHCLNFHPLAFNFLMPHLIIITNFQTTISHTMQAATDFTAADTGLPRNSQVAQRLAGASICLDYTAALHTVRSCMCHHAPCQSCDAVTTPEPRPIVNLDVRANEERWVGSSFGITMSSSEVALRVRCTGNREYEDDWATFARHEFEVHLTRDAVPDGYRWVGLAEPPYVRITVSVEEDVALITVAKVPGAPIACPAVAVGVQICSLQLTEDHFDRAFYEARQQ